MGTALQCVVSGRGAAPRSWKGRRNHGLLPWWHRACVPLWLSISGDTSTHRRAGTKGMVPSRAVPISIPPQDLPCSLLLPRLPPNPMSLLSGQAGGQGNMENSTCFFPDTIPITFSPSALLPGWLKARKG